VYGTSPLFFFGLPSCTPSAGPPLRDTVRVRPLAPFGTFRAPLTTYAADATDTDARPVAVLKGYDSCVKR